MGLRSIEAGHLARLLGDTPVEVDGAKNIDVRGLAAVMFDFDDASEVDYSWVRSLDASGHGFGETNVASQPTEAVTVIGNFLRVVPTGGTVFVHLVA